MVNFSDLSRDEQIIIFYRISNDIIIQKFSDEFNISKEEIKQNVLEEVTNQISIKKKSTLKKLIKKTRETMQKPSNRQWKINKN